MDLTVLNIFLHIQVTIYLNIPVFLEQGMEWNSLPSDIVFAKSLDISKSMWSDFLRGDCYEATLLQYLFIYKF